MPRVVRRARPVLAAISAAVFAVASALALAACGRFNDPVALRPVEAPRIAYDSVVVFTVGALAERVPVSSGGPIVSWSISPALPSGLALTASGAIQGLAAQADTGTSYVVTAKGPGGNGTAAFVLRVLPETVDPSIARPQIAYASPAKDTVGKAASHLVASTGGPVTGYAVSPALPPGLALNAATGAVTGTPTRAYGADDYAVIAFGPGGRDTATLTLSVLAPAAAGGETAPVGLTLRFLPSRLFPGPLDKRAATPGNLLPSVTLKRMFVVFHSSANDTLRDTVAAGAQGLPLKIDTTRAFVKEYPLLKLRPWSYNVRVFDVRDSLVFADSGSLATLSGGATASLDLHARYTGFRATYRFPDSVSRASDGRKWPITIRRLVLKVGNVDVADTSATGGFKNNEVFLEYPYLVSGRTYALTQTAFGSVDGRADTVLFQGTEIHAPRHEASEPVLPYVGPRDLE